MYFYSMLIYEHTHRTAIPNILFIRSSGTQSPTVTAEAGTSPSFQEHTNKDFCEVISDTNFFPIPF